MTYINSTTDQCVPFQFLGCDKAGNELFTEKSVIPVTGLYNTIKLLASSALESISQAYSAERAEIAGGAVALGGLVGAAVALKQGNRKAAIASAIIGGAGVAMGAGAFVASKI